MPLQLHAFCQLYREPKDYLSAATEGLTDIFKSFFSIGKAQKAVQLHPLRYK